MNENNEMQKKPLDSSTKIYHGYVTIEKEEEFIIYLNNHEHKDGKPYGENYSKNSIARLKFAAAHLGIDIFVTNIEKRDLKKYREKLKKVMHYKQKKKLTTGQLNDSNFALKKYHNYVKYIYSKLLKKEKLFEIRVIESSSLTSEERQHRINNSPKIPKIKTTTIETYIRNADVVAETLFRANGICESCLIPAPFIRISDGTAYLEVHHKLPLAEGGEDTLENTVAICPNCHRKEHYGNPKWPW